MTFAEGTSAILKIDFSLHRRGYFKLQNCTSGVIFADWTMPVCISHSNDRANRKSKGTRVLNHDAVARARVCVHRTRERLDRLTSMRAVRYWRQARMWARRLEKFVSLRRTNSVMKWLTLYKSATRSVLDIYSQHLDHDRLTSSGYGPSNNIAVVCSLYELRLESFPRSF
jgi:hypothetical protein